MKERSTEPPEYPELPVCPVCGSSFYRDIYLGPEGVVGCDDCIEWLPAEEWWDDLEIEREEQLEEEQYEWEEDWEDE